MNLYRYDTVKPTTSYVAPVLKMEQASGRNWFESQIPTGGENVSPNPKASFYTTPDGKYLLFATTRELTGYNTAGCNVPALPGTNSSYTRFIEPFDHCEELYRYHYEPGSSSGGSVLCVSCNPSGAPAVSHARFTRTVLQLSPARGQVRAMSNDGSRVFFDTEDALVPRDSNGTLDVYEWHEGSVSLISSGQDPAPSYFLGSSPDGANVFFGTHAKLVPQDTDTAGDLYDARVCTKTDPCIQPAVGGTGQCEGDACQSPTSPPIDSTPVTAAISPEGNLAPLTTTPATGPKRCTKGKVLKRGKCVKKKRHRHKKRGRHARRAVNHNRGGSR